MLLKLFAGISAVATALNIASTRTRHSGAKLAGLSLLRFAEFYVGSLAAYVAAVYAASELTVKKDEPQENPSKFWQWNMNELAEIVCTLVGAKVTVTGMEKLPEDRRYLMVCNHRSIFDPIASVKVFGAQEHIYISKPENFKIPIGGAVMHKCGCLPLNRDNNREAITTVKHASEIIKNDIASVVIYPEGTRSSEDKLLPFHAGSFKIAQRVGAPVVVTALCGTDEVVHNLPFKGTNIEIDIIDVLDGEFVKSHSTKEIAELAQKMIQENLDRKHAKKERLPKNV